MTDFMSQTREKPQNTCVIRLGMIYYVHYDKRTYRK